MKICHKLNRTCSSRRRRVPYHSRLGPLSNFVERGRNPTIVRSEMDLCTSLYLTDDRGVDVASAAGHAKGQLHVHQSMLRARFDSFQGIGKRSRLFRILGPSIVVEVLMCDPGAEQTDDALFVGFDCYCCCHNDPSDPSFGVKAVDGYMYIPPFTANTWPVT